jgi:hypothetical protein
MFLFWLFRKWLAEQLPQALDFAVITLLLGLADGNFGHVVIERPGHCGG